MKNNSNPELDAVDTDLREWYGENFDTEYVSGLPIKIQIVRLLRRLLGERDQAAITALIGKQPKPAGMRLRIGQWLSRTCGRCRHCAAPQERSGEQGRDKNPDGSRRHPGAAPVWSYSGLRKGDQNLTWAELDEIEKRSVNYAQALLGGRDEVPVEDLSDIGMMCLVDIPRLLGMIDTLREATKSSQPASAVPTEGKA